jgi:UPF0716 protein FxsA
LPYLLIAFILMPIAEIYVLLQVGGSIGALKTILIIIATGIAGAYLARMQGLMALRRMQQMVQSGQPPTDPLLDAVMVFVAGVVLLTPGFITDMMGLALLFPATRRVVKIWLKQKLARHVVYPPQDP